MSYFDRKGKELPDNWRCSERYFQEVPVYQDFDGNWIYEDREFTHCKWVAEEIKLDRCKLCGVTFRYP